MARRIRRVTAEAAFQQLMTMEESGADDTSDEDTAGADSEPDQVLDPQTEGSESESSSEEDAVVQVDGNEAEMISKNGLVRWRRTPYSTSGRQRAANIFRQHPGPSRQIRQSSASANEIFENFITPHMIRNIMQHTNAEGRRRNSAWKNADEEEIRKFIGLLLLSGVYCSKNEAISQLWSLKDGRPIFRQSMPRDRFTDLCSRLRFDDAQTRVERRADDKLAPFREIWDCFISKCKSNYVPGCDMTIDEQLVTFRGRCGFRMYIPSKPGRYGIKIWILTDSRTSYCYNADIYTGRRGNSREIGQASRVVLELTDPISNSGRNIIADNFFSSLHLVQALLGRQLTYLGTIRKNKPELPPQTLPSASRPVESSVFGFLPNCSIVSYVPKRSKAVTLISSNHRTAEISDTLQKPAMILDYNHSKSGVDTLDQVVRSYSCKRRTRRWPMCLFYNMLDIAAYNSYVIFISMNPGWNEGKSHRRRLFLIHLSRLLIQIDDQDTSSQQSTSQESHASSSQSSEPQYLANRRRCRLCGSKKDRKTRLICLRCHNPVCSDHLSPVCRNCF